MAGNDFIPSQYNAAMFGRDCHHENLSLLQIYGSLTVYTCNDCGETLAQLEGEMFTATELRRVVDQHPGEFPLAMRFLLGGPLE